MPYIAAGITTFSLLAPPVDAKLINNPNADSSAISIHVELVGSNKFYPLQESSDPNMDNYILTTINAADSPADSLSELLSLAEKAFPDSRMETEEEANALIAYRNRIFRKA